MIKRVHGDFHFPVRIDTLFVVVLWWGTTDDDSYIDDENFKVSQSPSLQRYVNDRIHHGRQHLQAMKLHRADCRLGNY